MSTGSEGLPGGRRVTIALASALALVAIALGMTLASAPTVILHANSTLANGSIAETATGAQACQSGEVLPAGTSAIRLTLTAEVGPRVSVKALAGNHVLTSGALGEGWTGGSVTVPVKEVTRAASNVQICFKLDPSKENVGLVGSTTGAAVAAVDGKGKPLPGRIKIEDLAVSHRSWLTVAPEVARRIGLGHAPSGTWAVLALLALMAATVVSASWLVLKELR